MYLGKIVEMAGRDELFDNPSHPYTKALLSAIPVGDPDIVSEKILLEGDIPSPVNPPSGCRFHTRCFMAQDICSQVEPPYVAIREGHMAACHLLPAWDGVMPEEPLTDLTAAAKAAD